VMMDINKQIVFLPDNDLQATTHFYKPFFDFIKCKHRCNAKCSHNNPKTREGNL